MSNHFLDVLSGLTTLKLFGKSKSEEKNIEKDVEKFGINAKIIEKADELYNIVTENKIYRGNTRKGIIYACVYHAYLLNNTPKSNEELINIFDINQKNCIISSIS